MQILFNLAEIFVAGIQFFTSFPQHLSLTFFVHKARRSIFRGNVFIM